MTEISTVIQAALAAYVRHGPAAHFSYALYPLPDGGTGVALSPSTPPSWPTEGDMAGMEEARLALEHLFKPHLLAPPRHISALPWTAPTTAHERIRRMEAFTLLAQNFTFASPPGDI